MKLSIQPPPKRLLIFYCGVALILSLAAVLSAQQTPAPSGHVNDFAGVVDEQTKAQMENILENLKVKTGIEFDVATVATTGAQDIFAFSRQLAKDWNIGSLATRKKSLLLVIAVNEKTSFTQFSKSVQNDLPEGVLGDLGQRMRPLVEAGQFSGALNAGVQYFVTALAQKQGLTVADFAKSPAMTASADQPVVDNSAKQMAGETAPGVIPSSTPASEPSRAEVPAAISKLAAPRRVTGVAKSKKPDASLDAAGEAEEVELTLTKPVAERVALLKTFVDKHPESPSRARALELLVAARAALGDQLLQQGDPAGGIAQLLSAIADAPVDASEKLFSGVISQVPLNLYLRGEPAAASQAAQKIETKFGSDPKRLVALSGFYVNTEQGAEATRLATQAVQLAPELAEAHQGLGRALHVSLRLAEAAREYKRALELDPTSKPARRGLADLDRAFGKSEEALALYRQQLEAEPADKSARAGLVLSLLDLGRAEEGKIELDKALAADPRNLPLLAGAAYWFAAHNQSAQALTLAAQAVQIEPRYTWAQIALARTLLAQNKPLEAERALRFARQYGKFSTLDYELASVLAAAGLYEEASELLLQSFNLNDDQLETRLGGQTSARGASFIELLAPERRASIFQSVGADNESNAKLLKALLTFALLTSSELEASALDAARATQAAKDLAAGDDAMRVYRQLFAATRMLQRGFGYETAYELAEAARSSADAGMNVPALTLAVQADEFRSIRARAIAAGGTPDIPDAPRNVLSNLLRGRIEDTSGWALLNQDKLTGATEHLRRAVAILPEGTPAARTALWHLGSALDRQDKKTEALTYYIKSYNAGDPDPVRRTVIEQSYRKLNGSLAGLEERIGPGATVSSTPAPATATPETTTATPEPTPLPAPTPELTPAKPEPTTTPAGPLATPATLETSPVEKMDKPPRTTVSITGRVKDAAGNPIANVVVVLISPQGTVLAATTDEQGKYSFTVAPSAATHNYRLIPSRDGLTFEPVDRSLPVVNDDIQELDFIAQPAK
jgi:uncharacterized membrane protein YgcG/tetratricopeptide (TPR) repeat protein